MVPTINQLLENQQLILAAATQPAYSKSAKISKSNLYYYSILLEGLVVIPETYFVCSHGYFVLLFLWCSELHPTGGHNVKPLKILLETPFPNKPGRPTLEWQHPLGIRYYVPQTIQMIQSNISACKVLNSQGMFPDIASPPTAPMLSHPATSLTANNHPNPGHSGKCQSKMCGSRK